MSSLRKTEISPIQNISDPSPAAKAASDLASKPSHGRAWLDIVARTGCKEAQLRLFSA